MVTHRLDTIKGLRIVTLDNVLHDHRLDPALLHRTTQNGEREGLLLGLRADGIADVPSVGEIYECGMDGTETVQTSDQDGRHRSSAGLGMTVT
jgi:hypothetical protein